MEVMTSPRRTVFSALALVGVVLVAAIVGVAASKPGDTTPLQLSGAASVVFLVFVAVRAFRCRLEVDAAGAVYRGLARTKRWAWSDVTSIDRQTVFAFGANGNAPQVTLRDGGAVVLVGLADPRHPDSEDRLIESLRSRLSA